MPVRSIRGFLLTVLGTVVIVVLGVCLHALLDPWSSVVPVVHGWRVAIASGVFGAAAWAALALADRLLGRRGVLLAGLVGVAIALSAFPRWEFSYWQRHGFVHAVRMDGRGGPPETGSTWRGVTGIPCGQPTIFDVTIGPNGTGVGVAENYFRVPSLILAIALAPLDGPNSYPVYVRLDVDSLRFHDGYGGPYAIPIH